MSSPEAQQSEDTNDGCECDLCPPDCDCVPEEVCIWCYSRVCQNHANKNEHGEWICKECYEPED